MAIYIIPKPVQKLWDKWNLRGAVLFSLLLQILLIFLASSRKRTGKIRIIGVVWLAYLMADVVAIFGVGLIVNKLSSDPGCDKGKLSNNMAAFWAPFLLLHLGGPDSITAFSIEDNELWKRHFLGLISEVIMVIYVVLLVIPNPFWIPTVLIFLAGTFKYAERTVALYRACWENLMNATRTSYHEPYNSDFPKGKGDGEIKAIKDGYRFYTKILRVLITESTSIPLDVLVNSKRTFLDTESRDAFRMMEVELNLMYDELFTKMAMVHMNRRLGNFFRYTCTGLLVVAFMLFSFHKKAGIKRLDILITYALLVGAIILDFVALIKFIFCDWMMASVENSYALRVMREIQKRISFGSRWSERIYTQNLIDKCLRKPCKGWLDSVNNCFQEVPYIKYHSPVGKNLRNIIFKHLWDIAAKTDDRIMADDSGLVFLKRDVSIQQYKDKCKCDMKIVKWSLSDEVGYDESLLLWHIATDYLYYKSKGSNNDTQDREAYKILSDYLFYLMEMRPALMPSKSALYQERLDKIRKRLTRYLASNSITRQEKVFENLPDYFKENTDNFELEVDESHNMLESAYYLAKELESMTNEDPVVTWEMIGKVLLDLLCYGAGSCRTTIEHAKHLAKGGDLITFVWLLMAHFKLSTPTLRLLKPPDSSEP